MKRRETRVRERLEAVYAKLLAYYGAQSWWPAESEWEVMVGAILTQNTSWKNVERALENLRRESVLTAAGIRAIESEHLRELVRPAGFTTSKPARLKRLAEFLFREYGGQVERMRGGDVAAQRAGLLALNGIGPETADAILLYAAGQPVFVIDAYTRRIFSRMGRWDGALGGSDPRVAAYETLQALFMDYLPRDVTLYGEYHALLDAHAKFTCTKRAPRCGECPLSRMCEKRLENGD